MTFLEKTICQLETFMFTIYHSSGYLPFQRYLATQKGYPDEIMCSELRMWSQPLKARMCPHTSTIDVFQQ